MEEAGCNEICLSKSSCFLCLKNEIKPRQFSLKNILQYLKINLSSIKTKVLNKSRNVKVDLCRDCYIIMEKFSEHYKVMELCRMEMEEILSGIKRLLETLDNNECQSQHDNCNKGSSLENLQNREDLDELRNEILDKCSRTLKDSPPKLILKRISQNEPFAKAPEDNENLKSSELPPSSSIVKISTKTRSPCKSDNVSNKISRKSSRHLRHLQNKSPNAKEDEISKEKRATPSNKSEVINKGRFLQEIILETDENNSTNIFAIKSELGQALSNKPEQDKDLVDIDIAPLSPEPIFIKTDGVQVTIMEVEEEPAWNCLSPPSPDEQDPLLLSPSPPSPPEPPPIVQVEKEVSISNKSSPQRRLRNVHKCALCTKTFSSLESLSAHKEKCAREGEIEEMNWNEGGITDEESSESDEDVFDNNDATEEEKQDSSSGASESEEDQQEEDEDDEEEEDNPSDSLPKSNRRGQRTLLDGESIQLDCPFCDKTLTRESHLQGHILSIHPDEWDPLQTDFQVKFINYRLKCPGAKCEKLFKETNSLLQHWQTSHSCDSQKLFIEIFSIAGGEQNLKPFTRIEVPTPEDIIFCETNTCKRVFYSKEDLNTHQKLHGSFRCVECSVAKDFLPDLAIHEIKAHDGIKKRNQGLSVFNCRRCPQSFADIYFYLNHFTSVHYSLSLADQSCPACRSFLIGYFPYSGKAPQLFRHLKKCHDLSNNKGFSYCEEENCSAYFVDESSLRFHVGVDHRGRKVKEKRSVFKHKVKVKKERKVRQRKNENGDRVHCPYCTASYTKKDNLKHHILSNHPEADKDKFLSDYKSRVYLKFKCCDCDKVFKEVHTLQVHCKEAHQITKSTKKGNLIIEILHFPLNPDRELYKDFDNEASKPTVFARIEVSPLEEDQTVFVCEKETCNRPFYSREEFATHEKLHGSFTCFSCPVSKDFLPELAMHELRIHNGIKKNFPGMSCRRCEEKFTYVVDYMRHFASVHFGFNFNEKSCPLCKGYMILYEQKWDVGNRVFWILFKHLRNAHNLDVEKTDSAHIGRRCEEPNCSVFFSNLSALAKHWRVDHKLSESKMKEMSAARIARVCEECGKKFKDEEKLKQHRLSHAGPESWEFTCEVCSKKCRTMQKLQEHMRTHTKEKPFVCEVCGVKYAHRHNLRIHVNNKHGDVMQDVPRKFEKVNLTSTKGIKKKKPADLDDENGGKKKRRKKTSKPREEETDFSESD